ncbi:hypothetical protein T4B_1007, partial [Trichinella pseudospiralis]
LRFVYQKRHANFLTPAVLLLGGLSFNGFRRTVCAANARAFFLRRRWYNSIKEGSAFCLLLICFIKLIRLHLVKPVQTINKKNEKGSALITITWMEIWTMKKRKSENADDTKQIADGMKQIEDDTKQNRE